MLAQFGIWWHHDIACCRVRYDDVLRWVFNLGQLLNVVYLQAVRCWVLYRSSVLDDNLKHYIENSFHWWVNVFGLVLAYACRRMTSSGYGEPSAGTHNYNSGMLVKHRVSGNWLTNKRCLCQQPSFLPWNTQVQASSMRYAYQSFVKLFLGAWDNQ